MQKPTNLKAGDQFRVTVKGFYFDVGEIITLKHDDGTICPFFWNADGSYCNYIQFSKLEPYPKTIRDAQVGDVVVNRSGGEHMVLERGQNTVTLSYFGDFKKSSGNFHFDELEENFTLKAEPVAVDDKTAEAMEILKKAGYKISKE